MIFIKSSLPLYLYLKVSVIIQHCIANILALVIHSYPVADPEFDLIEGVDFVNAGVENHFKLVEVKSHFSVFLPYFF